MGSPSGFGGRIRGQAAPFGERTLRGGYGLVLGALRSRVRPDPIMCG